MELKTLENGDTLELVILPPDWFPHVAQVNYITKDGLNYGRPGVAIRTSMSNFDDVKKAKVYFDTKI